MADNVNTTENNTVGAQAEANTPNNTATETGKTFTQDELNEILNKRLEKERKKQPSKEELTAFTEWKKSQQTEQEKQQELLREHAQLKAQYENALLEQEQTKNQFYLIQKGVPIEDLDYYAFKINKMQDEDTPFEKAAENFLKDKQITQSTKQTVSIAFGAQQKSGATQSLADRINNKLRGGL